MVFLELLAVPKVSAGAVPTVFEVFLELLAAPKVFAGAVPTVSAGAVPMVSVGAFLELPAVPMEV